jgi:hypothetical protein
VNNGTVKTLMISETTLDRRTKETDKQLSTWEGV